MIPRHYTNSQFAKLLPAFTAGKIDSKTFRSKVIAATVKRFPEMTESAAAAHYNHSLREARVNTPELVAELGRPEGLSVGRQPKTVYNVLVAKGKKIVAKGVSMYRADIIIRTAAAHGQPTLRMSDPITVGASA